MNEVKKFIELLKQLDTDKQKHIYYMMCGAKIALNKRR